MTLTIQKLELSKNDHFEVYAFRWSAVSSAALFGGMVAVLTVPIIDRYGPVGNIMITQYKNCNSFGIFDVCKTM